MEPMKANSYLMKAQDIALHFDGINALQDINTNVGRQ